MRHSMRHRHIDTQEYVLPAIDDIISRGNRNDWIELRDATLADHSIKQKILDICKHYASDNSIRYDFWPVFLSMYCQ